MVWGLNVIITARVRDSLHKFVYDLFALGNAPADGLWREERVATNESDSFIGNFSLSSLSISLAVVPNVNRVQKSFSNII